MTVITIAYKSESKSWPGREDWDAARRDVSIMTVGDTVAGHMITILQQLHFLCLCVPLENVQNVSLLSGHEVSLHGTKKTSVVL